MVTSREHIEKNSGNDGGCSKDEINVVQWEKHIKVIRTLSKDQFVNYAIVGKENSGNDGWGSSEDNTNTDW